MLDSSPVLSEPHPGPAGTSPTRWSCVTATDVMTTDRRILTTGSDTSGTMLHWILQPLRAVHHGNRT
ncbi:hypothetical protein INR49_022502, partial [Caranx melampygus]